jgi:thiamine-phosphate pyrophosphorylase
MVVVISHPTPIVDEAAIINALFEEGLEVLHLRKPTATEDEMTSLMNKIKPKHHAQVTLHQHHEIANDFGMNRLHFNETDRKKMGEKELLKLKTKNTILSTSIHQPEEYEGLPVLFDYTFFGPVFDSISKKGYTSSLASGFVFPIQQGHPKVIAIGGIDRDTTSKTRKMEFNGVAALGAIWQHPKESVRQFKAIQEAWKQADRLC